MKLTIGTLYRIKEYFWLLYPDKERAAVAAEAVSVGGLAASAAAWWSKELKCRVRVVSEHRTLMVVESDDCQHHVVSVDGVGWINVPEEEWALACFEELKS